MPGKQRPPSPCTAGGAQVLRRPLRRMGQQAAACTIFGSKLSRGRGSPAETSQQQLDSAASSLALEALGGKNRCSNHLCPEWLRQEHGGPARSAAWEGLSSEHFPEPFPGPQEPSIFPNFGIWHLQDLFPLLSLPAFLLWPQGEEERERRLVSF